MSVTGYKVYNYYIALKLHYYGINSKYDAWKEGFLLTHTQENFQSRNDKIFFDKISHSNFLESEDDLVIYFTAYFIELGDVHISKMANDSKPLIDFVKRHKDIEKVFENDMKMIDISRLDNIVLGRPLLFDQMLRGEISKETLSILNAISHDNLFAKFEALEDTLWIKYRFLLRKYWRFLVDRIDITKMKITLAKASSEQNKNRG